MTDIRKSVDQAGIDRWAEISGDFNALHVDPVAAARSRYGGTILHGHLTIAWLMEWGMREWGTEWVSSGRVAGLRYRSALRPDVEYRLQASASGSGAIALVVMAPDGEAAVTAELSMRGRPSCRMTEG